MPLGWWTKCSIIVALHIISAESEEDNTALPPVTGPKDSTNLSDLAIIGIAAAVIAFVAIIVPVILFCVSRYDNRFSRYLDKRKVDQIKATTSTDGGRAIPTSPADRENSRNNSEEEIQPFIDTTNTAEENQLHVMATEQVQADVLEGPLSEEMAEDDAYLKAAPKTKPHFSDIKNLLGVTDLENLYIALGLKNAEIQKAKAGSAIRQVGVDEIARLVFNMWRQQNSQEDTTREAILEGLGDARNMLAKQHFAEKWRNAVKQPVSDQDIEDVISKLGPADLDNLYLEIGLESDDIEKAKGAALQNANVQKQAVLVLDYWKKTYPLRATLGNILEALRKAKNIEAMETLQGMWKPKPKDPKDEDEPDLT